MSGPWLIQSGGDADPRQALAFNREQIKVAVERMCGATGGELETLVWGLTVDPDSDGNSVIPTGVKTHHTVERHGVKSMTFLDGYIMSTDLSKTVLAPHMPRPIDDAARDGNKVVLYGHDIYDAKTLVMSMGWWEKPERGAGRWAGAGYCSGSHYVFTHYAIPMGHPEA